MKVSVIVPVYNVEKYLEKCLDSLINQTFKEYEIIIVNDGSPDDSQTIIDKYKKQYPNKIKAYQKENGGLSSARNFGLNKSEGKYVVFVDSDDYVTNDYIEKLYNKITENDYDIVVCDLIQKSEQNEKIFSGKQNYNTDIIKDLLISLPAAWNKIYKKNLFVKNDIYYPDKIYYEDLATTPRLLVNSNKIGYLNKPLYYYMVRNNSITHQTKYNPKTSDIFTSLQILDNYFKSSNYYEIYKSELEYLYIVHLLHGFVINNYKYEESKQEINKAIELIKEKFPNWSKNKYFKKENWKYKLVCKLIFKKQFSLLKKILK